MSRLRILLADDSESMRLAYQNMLGTVEDIEVVATVSDGQEALDSAAELTPDVAVLDVRMPKLDGLAVANRITATSSETAIVLVSAYDDLAFVRAIMHSGASRKAYILKSSLGDIPEFIRVIRAVAGGQAVLQGSIAQSLIDIYKRLTPSQATPLADPEQEVLKLILEGYDEASVAQKLGLSIEMEETHVTSLCEKLEVVAQPGMNRSPQVVQALVNLCVS